MSSEPALNVFAGGTELLERRRQISRPTEGTSSPEYCARSAPIATTDFENLQDTTAHENNNLTSFYKIMLVVNKV